MIKLILDLQVKELPKVLDLLQPNNAIGLEIYQEFNKTFSRKEGIIEAKEFKNGSFLVKFTPYETFESGGFYRLKEFNLSIECEVIDYNDFIEVLQGLKAPF